MDSYNSKLFGPLPCPSSFDELVSILHVPLEKWAVRMWRGQGDLDWPIHSTAYRRLVSEYKEVNEPTLQHYEKGLLQRAEHKGFRLRDGRELSDLEMLARLRHHGAATRFVDATRNALVGLWFCVVDRVDRPGLLLGIHCNYLGGYEGLPDKSSYDEIFNDRLPVTHPQTWEPPQVSVRVAAQHSQMLYSPIVDDRPGSLALPKEDGATLFIAIMPKLKEECTRILCDVLDLRRTTLFPDLDGFGVANGVQFDRFSSYRW